MADAANQGFTKVLVAQLLVVISVAALHQIQLSELWVAFGTGKHFRYLLHVPVHDICQRISPITSRALLAFHAFTGCDQTSFFAHRGKQTAWEAWDAFSEVTSFRVLSDAPTLEDVCEQLPTLERYIIIMYDLSNTCKEVNEARRDLFTRKGRDIEGIPPTADALHLHTKRCAYQAGHCWGKALVPSHPIPSHVQVNGAGCRVPVKFTNHYL